MSAANARILVVDDDDNNRYALIRRLSAEGYSEMGVAENGKRALEMLVEEKFDLVLLDVMMPEIDGYDVLQRMKSHQAWRDIPVIMISAIDEIESVVRCIKLGAEDYLAKPFNSLLLKARIGSSLDKKRLRDKEVFYLEQLRSEKQRADDLLNAILPPSAVSELKATNAVTPRRHKDVTVLFCDIVGFTRYCDQQPAEKVVSELQEMVHCFEGIVAAHGMEKIKTIGDAFMATAGLLHPIDDGVLAAVQCGGAMIAASQALQPGRSVRVGIHCGPVVAGIMGRRQYSFDLWGDTVNTAARITAQAAGGSMLLSPAAWQRVRDRCRGQSCGLERRTFR